MGNDIFDRRGKDTFSAVSAPGIRDEAFPAVQVLVLRSVSMEEMNHFLPYIYAEETYSENSGSRLLKD